MHDKNKTLRTAAELDDRILELLNERAATEANRLKQAGHHQQWTFTNILVESYGRIEEYSGGPLPESALKSIYREIVSATLALVKPNRVAYLGPPATFAHMACLRGFGSSAEAQPVVSIAQVFEEVESGRADYGVVPVENSTEGTVTYTMDMFVDSPLKICGEILLQISQNLLSKVDNIEAIRKVYSHPQALAQCRFWLETNLPGVEMVEMDSTAKAAELASREPGAAAVASEAASAIYDLHILGPNIQDKSNNFTRFFIIGTLPTAPTGSDRTSILFSVKHEVGALFNGLKILGDNGLNLTQIESRPSKKKAWEYIFFVDFEGHLEQEKVSRAIKQLEEACLFIKVLGSYPRSE